MAFDMSKFIGRFVEEAREHLEGLNRGLVELERNPDDAETINTIFRAAHTIKGSSRMLKLTAITEVAHKLEDALGALREKRISHSRELASLLFKGIDMVSALVEKVSAGEPLVLDTAALRDELAQAAEGKLSPPSPAPEAPPAEAAPTRAAAPPPESTVECVAQPQQHAARPAATSESIRVKAEKLDDLIRLMGEVVSLQNKLKQRIIDLNALEREAARQVEACEQSGDAAVRVKARSLHVGLKQLLSVMRQDKTLQDILTAEFQEKALRLRMVPLSTVFDPLHRLIRDISESLSKEVDFEVEGGDIELDKKMVEKLSDPLVHMLRNSLDHGIEEPAVRQQHGKQARGRVRLSAAYEAGSIVIELRDDGAGISVGRIREKALSKKLFDAATLDSMPESALLDLIFLPGFSTSGLITDISGRGVGMDVVKRNIVEELKGSIRIETAAGQGSAFIIRLPMTLAIMRILLVSCQGTTFGITTHFVVEIVKTPRSEIIDVVDRKAIRLREELIPVADLAGLLRIEDDNRKSLDTALLLIVKTGAEKIGFIVDAILDEESMVIKSLPEHMKNVRLVSGVTISGRNEIINILNMPALMEASRRDGAQRIAAAARHADDAGRTASILVADDSVNTREIEKSILEAYGYTVTIASDGMEALEMAGAAKYDLVITDVEMPRMDGFSLTERLRGDDSYRDTPIIIVTSREKEEDKKRGMRVGANAYIVKGAFDQTNLLETVQNLIG